MKCLVCSARDSCTLKSSSLLFRFAHDRECTDCGTVWCPACPKWAAILAVLLGGPFAFILVQAAVTETQSAGTVGEVRISLRAAFIFGFFLLGAASTVSGIPGTQY